MPNIHPRRHKFSSISSWISKSRPRNPRSPPPSNSSLPQTYASKCNFPLVAHIVIYTIQFVFLLFSIYLFLYLVFLIFFLIYSTHVIYQCKLLITILVALIYLHLNLKHFKNLYVLKDKERKLHGYVRGRYFWLKTLFLSMYLF